MAVSCARAILLNNFLESQPPAGDAGGFLRRGFVALASVFLKQARSASKYGQNAMHGAYPGRAPFVIKHVVHCLQHRA